MIILSKQTSKYPSSYKNQPNVQLRHGKTLRDIQYAKFHREYIIHPHLISNNTLLLTGGPLAPGKPGIPCFPLIPGTPGGPKSPGPPGGPWGQSAYKFRTAVLHKIRTCQQRLTTTSKNIQEVLMASI